MIRKLRKWAHSDAAFAQERRARSPLRRCLGCLALARREGTRSLPAVQGMRGSSAITRCAALSPSARAVHAANWPALTRGRHLRNPSGAEHYSRGPQFFGHSTVSQDFMEPEGSVPNSQQLSTCSYPEPDPFHLYKIYPTTYVLVFLVTSFPLAFPPTAYSRSSSC
jgi:hypothetical protein